MTAARMPTALILLLLSVWPAGCRRPEADVVARDLAATAEEMAKIMASAQTVKDLEANKERLQNLARRTRDLLKQARRVRGETTDAYAVRLNAALRKIEAVRVAWLKAGKKDMVDFTDSLRDR